MSHNIEDYLKPETIQRIKDNHLVLLAYSCWQAIEGTTKNGLCPKILGGGALYCQ